MYVFGDHNLRIVNLIFLFFFQSPEPATLHSSITVFYVTLAKGSCNQKFFGVIIKLVSMCISTALYCLEYQRYSRFHLLQSDTNK